VAKLADYLLTRDMQPDGPRQISVTARPNRLIYLVDPDDPALALAAIESACLTWGGIHHFLIPCTPGGRPDAIWAKILEKHDPDAIIDLVGADQGFLSDQHARWDRYTHRWNNPTTTMEVVGATVFSSLSRWQEVRSPAQSYLTVNLHPLTGHALALPLAFRLGHLDQRPMNSGKVLSIAYAAARLQQFVDVRDVDPGSLGEQELIQLAAAIPVPLDLAVAQLPNGIVEWRSLPDLTRRLLPRREPSYWHDYSGLPNPEADQTDEAFFSRIVVIGPPDSVPDLCLAWNIRAQRASATGFPLWLAPGWLQRPEVITHINHGRAR
jgi:hypothetical protein